LGNAQSTYYPYSAYIRGIQGAGIDYYRMEFGTSNGSAAATRMTIAEDGNVGIGTTRQSGKLHVAGNIFLSADLIGNDGTRGYLLGKDSVSAGRVYLILDPNAANGIGVGSDYLYIAQENTTGVISNSAGPLVEEMSA
jgi:hypothetical protein